MTVDDFNAQIQRNGCNDPQPGCKAHVREGTSRTVTGRFIDACGTPYVIYTTEHRIPLRSWKCWFKSIGATV